MKNIFLIAQRDFLAQIKNKTFIIMTFLSPLLIAGAGAVIFFISTTVNSEIKNIAVVDESAEFITSFKSSKQRIFYIYTPQELQSLKDTLKDSKYINAILHIPKIENGDYSIVENNTELFINNNIGIVDTQEISSIISEKIKKEKQLELGISQDILDACQSRVNINVFNTSNGKKNKGIELQIALSIFLTYIIFMFVMIYGIKVMRSVVEEKSNRVVEIIISSVKPFQLMMGKILGTTMVAIIQFSIWIGITMNFLIIFPTVTSTRIQSLHNVITQSVVEDVHPDTIQKISEISEVLLTFNYPLIIFSFIVYFILGYLFYSSIFTAIGSAVDNDTDTQQFTFFPIIPMMISMYGSLTTYQNPDGPLAFWLSMIPFTSPISMIARIPFGVPIWQLIISLLMLLFSSIFTVYISGKIYRIGILTFGNKITIKEMIKWINYKN